MAKGINNLFQNATDTRVLKIFNSGNFTLLFLTSVAISVGNVMMMVALSWLVLDLTGSSLSLGIVWASRSLPNMLFGLLAGSLADKFNKRNLLVWTFSILSACSLVVGLLITFNMIQLWHVIVLTFLIGTLMTFDGATRQAFVVDLVDRKDTMSAISVNAFGMRMMGVFGGAVAGFIIEIWGTEWAFYIKFVTYLIAIGIILFITNLKPIGLKKQSIQGNFLEGLNIISQNHVVLALMVMAAACEILGFSHKVVTPIFARDILHVGAIGLGMFSTATSIGGLLALIILFLLGDYRHKGRIMLGVFLSFGILLILFSFSPWYPASLILIGLVGSMAASHDALQHTLLQLNVTQEQRGRAIGLWQMSIGLGPVGMLTLGWLADLLGASIALSSFGFMMIMIFFILTLFIPKLSQV